MYYITNTQQRSIKAGVREEQDASSRFPRIGLGFCRHSGRYPGAGSNCRRKRVESAEDAFGTSTGHETIGVYDEGNVRGFSPGTAGNFRMEGMYFDIQGGLGNRVIDGETIRVGPAAQGYAFPAPTGVVDLQLKKAGDKLVVAPFLSADSFGGLGFEVDAQIPLSGKTLGVGPGSAFMTTASTTTAVRSDTIWA